MTETDEPSVEPPVMKNGELVVRCDHSGCNRTASFGTDVDAVESTADGSNWRVAFVPTADGRLEVDTVECPDHRIDDAIDSLAADIQDYSKNVYKTSKFVDEKLAD